MYTAISDPVLPQQHHVDHLCQRRAGEQRQNQDRPLQPRQVFQPIAEARGEYGSQIPNAMMAVTWIMALSFAAAASARVASSKRNRLQRGEKYHQRVAEDLQKANEPALATLPRYFVRARGACPLFGLRLRKAPWSLRLCRSLGGD
jgi:hypothetical protein